MSAAEQGLPEPAEQAAAVGTNLKAAHAKRALISGISWPHCSLLP